MEDTILKGFKVRLFPTKEQEEIMWKHVGAARWIWNQMIDIQKQNYADGNKYLFPFSMCRKITELKSSQDNDWLNDVGIHTLQIVCKDLHGAYKLFFENRYGYPKYKSRKKSNKSFPITSYNKATYFRTNDVIKLPKIGNVKYKSRYKDFPVRYGIYQTTLYNPRISYKNNKWILSFALEIERKDSRPKQNISVGIDLGIKKLATVAIGDNEHKDFDNINKSYRIIKLEQKKRHIQRNMSRKWRQNGHNAQSSNYIKAKRELEVVQQRLNNIRHNYIHQITHWIISQNPHTIVMENLMILNMIKNRHMAKHILDSKWGEFIYQMRYKCEWNGINFMQVDRFYPSSKTCSRCGAIKSGLQLKERIYKCPECGLEIDRDYNAALNLMRYGSH